MEQEIRNKKGKKAEKSNLIGGFLILVTGNADKEQVVRAMLL